MVANEPQFTSVTTELSIQPQRAPWFHRNLRSSKLGLSEKRIETFCFSIRPIGFERSMRLYVPPSIRNRLSVQALAKNQVPKQSSNLELGSMHWRFVKKNASGLVFSLTHFPAEKYSGDTAPGISTLLFPYPAIP